jgi:hypothetical protein
LFRTVPGVTTADEIEAFLQCAPRFDASPDEHDRPDWLHPGEYCYSCEYGALTHYLSPAELLGPAPPCQVRITDPGPERLPVIIEVRRHRQLSLEESAELFKDGTEVVVEFEPGKIEAARAFVVRMAELGAIAALSTEDS